MKSKGKSVTLSIDEVSINKTKSQYTVTFTKEGPDKISVHLEKLVVDGENWRGGNERCSTNPNRLKSRPHLALFGDLSEIDLAVAAVDEPDLPSLKLVRADGSQYSLGAFAIHDGRHAYAHVEHLMHLRFGHFTLGL